ncbi:MAG: MiaB/RimO family radical SAM methylthiotransferase [Myxococcota bacterium]
MKVYIETLGCKVNFSDSSHIATLLRNNGHSIAMKPEEAEIFIINSCSVTHRAERECRQIARRYYNLNHNIQIIITGCSIRSESFLSRLQDIPFVKIAPLNDIPKILGLSGEKVDNPYFNRSRPFIKIQEGCNRFCAYCIVPFLRGAPISIERDRILNQIEYALINGYQEIVLVGTHLMLYEDPHSKTDIFQLLSDIERLNYNFRVRLSSIEPFGLKEENIKRLSEYRKLCQHFHIPLQSGSGKVLRDMNRDYDISRYISVLSSIKKYMPEATIGTDIIVGFPTETEQDFAETERFVLNEPIDYMHIFRYSRREGTAAFSMKGVSNSTEIKNRSDRLLKISFEKRHNMIKRNLGKVMDIIITDNNINSTGLTHNYIQVIIQDTSLRKGKMYRARLLSFNSNNKVNGEIL